MGAGNEQRAESSGIGVEGVVYSGTGDLVIHVIVSEPLAGPSDGLDGDDVGDLDESNVRPEVSGQVLPLRVPLQGIYLAPDFRIAAVDVDDAIDAARNLERSLGRVDNDLVEEPVGGVAHAQITGVGAGLSPIGFVVCGDGGGAVQPSLSLTTMTPAPLDSARGSLSGIAGLFRGTDAGTGVRGGGDSGTL
jgi:hypothetical protein